MAESRNRAFAKLAKDVTATGNIKAEGISSDVTLGGATVYATRVAMPMSGNTSGDQAYVTENNRLYIWNGSGWFSVALINTTPTITNAPSSVYNLYANGSPTIITLAATDEDGDTLTWSYSSASASGKATITQADNVFTITPLTDIADTSFTIDFQVTDGINTSTATSTINIDNRAPVIDTGPSATYALATDGSPTVITLAATDPDGGSITWSYAATGLSGQATVVQNVNEFTITPTTVAAAYTDFTLTFTASDSIESTSTDATTFSLTFILLADAWSDIVLSIGTSSTNGLDNSTFVDRSTNASTVTQTGSPVQTAFHPYLDNWSMEVSGGPEWIQTISSQSAFDFSDDGDFTIEMWVKDNLSTDGVRTIMNMKSGSYGFLLRRHSSNRWELYYNGTSRTYLNIADYGGLTDWYHMAITHSGGTLRWFVNGTAGFTTTSINTSNYNFTTLDLASYANGNWNGYFSNVRVVKGTALYTSDFTPPTEKLTAVSGTTFLGYQSNRFIDNSGNNEQITISAGNPKISAFNPFGQESEYAVGENKGATYFDGGASGKIDVDSSSTLDFAGDFTVQFWVYFESFGNFYRLFDRGGVIASNNISLFLENTTGAISAHFNNTTNQASSNGVVRLYEWIHIAFVRSGSATNNCSVYVNGAEEITFTSTAGVNPNQPFTLGNINGLDRPLNGYMSDFYVTNQTALYTTAFTPPTAPVGNTNADLYLPMDNAGVFDKTGYHNVVLNGTTVVSTAQSKYASSSLALTNRTFKVDYSPAMNIGANDFTMEMWVYPTNSTGGTLWSAGYNGENRFDFGWQVSSGIRLLLEVGNVVETVFTSSTAVSNYLNQWVHIALVRSGNTFNLYVNGAGQSTGTSTKILINDVTDGWTFGGREFDANFDDGATNDPFYGYIEGVQFTRAAKYTTPFSVPTQEQGRTYQAES